MRKDCSRPRVGYVFSLVDMCRLNKVACEHFNRVIGMVLNWLVAVKLEKECNCISHSLVVCDRVCA